jgi:hypothetical protein
MSRSEIRAKARTAIGLSGSDLTYGHYLAEVAVVMVDISLRFAEESVTEDEFFAIVRGVIRRQSLKEKNENSLASTLGSEEAGANKILDSNFSDYEEITAMQIQAIKDGRFDSKMKNGTLDSELMFNTRGREIIEHLKDLRSSGLTSKHKIADLVAKAKSSTSSSSSSPRTSTGFKVGDTVCNPQFLRTWSGRIVAISGTTYSVRIDYAQDKFRYNGTMSMFANEFKRESAKSVLQIFDRFKGVLGK